MNLEIDKAISLFSEKMNTLTQNNVEDYKKSIQMMLFKSEDNLKERSNNYWMEIKENSFYFDRKFILNEELAKIKAEEVIATFNNIFVNEPKKLSIQVNFIKNFRFLQETLISLRFLII